MATTAKTIKLVDLAKAIEKAVAASSDTKIPGGIIMGRLVPRELAGKIDANAVAKDITRQVAKSVPGIKLTPKVIIDGGITTMGFIFRPVEFDQ
jgi:hypothetical protein